MRERNDEGTAGRGPRVDWEGLPMLLVGGGSGAARQSAGRVRQLTASAYRAQAPGHRHVAILGAAAIDELQPAWVVALRERTNSRVVLCAPQARPSRLLSWFEAGVTDVLGARELADLLQRGRRRLSVSLVRRRLPAADWWMGEPLLDSEGLEMLSSLARVPCAHSAARWAEDLGCSARALRERCRRHLGGPPRQVLRSYMLAMYEHFRGEGWGCEAIAEGLGYADAASLLHAVARARESEGR